MEECAEAPAPAPFSTNRSVGLHLSDLLVAEVILQTRVASACCHYDGDGGSRAIPGRELTR